jgi:hypothetical protein
MTKCLSRAHQWRQIDEQSKRIQGYQFSYEQALTEILMSTSADGYADVYTPRTPILSYDRIARPRREHLMVRCATPVYHHGETRPQSAIPIPIQPRIEKSSAAPSCTASAKDKAWGFTEHQTTQQKHLILLANLPTPENGAYWDSGTNLPLPCN